MSSQYGVWRPVAGRLLLKIPYSKTNRVWLKETLGDRIRPEWNKGERRWEIARNHFGPVVEALAKRLGRIDVYIDFSCTERCDTRCKNARGRECNCQCLGRHHGRDGITHGWKVVGDTMEVRSTGIQQRHLVVIGKVG